MRARTSFVGSSPNRKRIASAASSEPPNHLQRCSSSSPSMKRLHASCASRLEAPRRPCGRGANCRSSPAADPSTLPRRTARLLAAPTCPRPRLPRRATIFPLNALPQRPVLSGWILSRYKMQLSNYNRFIDHRTRSRFLLISSLRPTVRSCSAGSSSRRRRA